MIKKSKFTETQKNNVTLTKKNGSWSKADVLVQHKGKEMNIHFEWLVDKSKAESWGSPVSYYLLTDASKKLLGLSFKVFSKKMRVGSVEWTGRENKGEGVHSLEECLADEKLFDAIGNSPIRFSLDAARKDVLAAINTANSQDLEWQENHIFKTDPEEQRVNRFGFDHTRKTLKSARSHTEAHVASNCEAAQRKRLESDPLLKKMIDLDSISRNKRVHRKASVAVAKAKGKPLSAKEVMALRSEEAKARMALTKKLLQEKYKRK